LFLIFLSQGGPFPGVFADVKRKERWEPVFIHGTGIGYLTVRQPSARCDTLVNLFACMGLIYGDCRLPSTLLGIPSSS